MNPGTGPTGENLIGWERTGKAEKGGAQPMGEDFRNPARDGRAARPEEKSNFSSVIAHD